MATLLLIHGGLWDNTDAGRFWGAPGIIAGLRRHGLEVIAPDRLRQAPAWTAEAAHLAPATALAPVTAASPVTVLAGSNGCSAAARLAVDFTGLVAGLLLAWPATAGDPAVDTRDRTRLAGRGAPPQAIGALLAGETLRGLTDAELASLTIPVGVLPSVPANPFHQRRTADALLRLLPRAKELPGCPEPPSPEFPPHLEAFLATVTAFAVGQLPGDNHPNSRH